MDDPEQPRSDQEPLNSLNRDESQPRTERTIQARAPILRPLRLRLQEAAAHAQVLPEVIERDYALSYVLAGLASEPALAETLVFKGGTALKKLFFADYRFSEDLDFSTIRAPTGEELRSAVEQAIRAAEQRLGAHGPFALAIKPLRLRDPHPGRQAAFEVRVKFPWDARPMEHVQTRTKIEITHDEPVLLAPVPRPLHHGYEEALVVPVLCYRLEEVVAEKLRTLLQTDQRLAARGWNRPRARDYYDLWRILRERGDEIEREPLPSLLEQKCAHRGVSFRGLDDFFTDRLTAEARANWERNLGAFVRELPACEGVLAELRALLPQFVPGLR